MRIVAQRVQEASVSVDGEIVGKIGKGLLLLVGIGHEDDDADLQYLAEKIANLRIFNDDNGKMNLSLLQTSKEVLAVSQFTLYANTRKGRRPSFLDSAPPDIAEPMFEQFLRRLESEGLQVWKGVFGANMMVKIFNDGPVTIILDSNERRLPRK